LITVRAGVVTETIVRVVTLAAAVGRPTVETGDRTNGGLGAAGGVSGCAYTGTIREQELAVARSSCTSARPDGPRTGEPASKPFRKDDACLTMVPAESSSFIAAGPQTRRSCR